MFVSCLCVFANFCVEVGLPLYFCELVTLGAKTFLQRQDILSGLHFNEMLLEGLWRHFTIHVRLSDDSCSLFRSYFI